MSPSPDAGNGDPKPAPACTLVIFGAGGDLAKRLLAPALYDLALAKLLDEKFAVLGVDRGEGGDEKWREALTGFVHELATDPTSEFNAGKLDPETWDFVRSRLSYMPGDFTKPETFEELAKRVPGSAVFYLATDSRFFVPIAEALDEAGLLTEGGGTFRRLIMEKPFGRDLASAQDIDRKLLKLADESQLFRIDHFPGKETVQNIMALRFANRIFEPVWSAEHIDHVQITAAEVVGVEGRGSFYEPTGALRDMVPNHLFQLLALTAMEPPENFEEKAVLDAKAKLVKAIRPVRPEDAVRGQYAAGAIGGKAVPAYRTEKGVAPDSGTETYAALKLEIDNKRWRGVPFYLRSGKRMALHRTEVAVRFKPASHPLFHAASGEAPEPNLLRLAIDGEKGVRTEIQAKRPGPEMVLASVAQTFREDDFFPPRPNVGYETLLYDCMLGDATLFQRADAIEGAWAAVEPAIEAWASGAPAFYNAGSAGPAEADALLERDGRAWLPLE